MDLTPDERKAVARMNRALRPYQSGDLVCTVKNGDLVQLSSRGPNPDTWLIRYLDDGYECYMHEDGFLGVMGPGEIIVDSQE